MLGSPPFFPAPWNCSRAVECLKRRLQSSMLWGAAMNESGPWTAIKTAKEVHHLKCQVIFLANNEAMLFLLPKLGFNHENAEFVHLGLSQDGGHQK